MIGRNNPFNLRYSKNNHWLGLTGQTRGFCDFVNMDFGIRAAALLVMRSYRKKDVLTISEIIRRFAPATENNTEKYVDFVCRQLSCFHFDIPSRAEYPALLCAMSVFEGNPVCIDAINFAIAKFNIVPYKKKK